MSKRQQIRIVVQSTATPAELYRRLVDGPSWVAWSPIDECVPEDLGPDGEEKVGTVRMNRRGRTKGWDRITEMTPDRSFGYEHLKGLPVRDYVATVNLAPAPAGGTTIEWLAGFEPRWPGTGGLLRTRIEEFLENCARGLAASATP